MVIIPRCTECKHRTRGRSLPRRTCAAFPGGIPDEIYWNKVDHDQPYPGDHGIQFELDPEYANEEEESTAS